MDNDEIVGQRRYFSAAGVAPVTCERCGLPVESATAVVVDGTPGIAEPIESSVVCSACLAMIQQGLEPVELADIE